MAKGYRYSLIYESDNGNKISLSQVKKVNKRNIEIIRKKFPLTQIDAFTTRLSGEDELRMLFEYLLKEKLASGNFWIEYTINKKNKTMRVAYANDENLAYLSNENIGKTYVEATYQYETYVNNLLFRFIVDPALYKYLKENKYINKYVLNKIEKYMSAKALENEELINYTFRKVREALTSYKIIRNIEDGIVEYQKKEEIKYSESPFGKEKGHQYKLF